jgi:hypothetical protein
MASFLSNPQSFSHFPDLPVEIRLRIWQFAAPCRPRVIQIGYDPNKSCWKAWKDGLGGLPSIVHVSQEAREEALKPYTKVFDAYVDPDEDTIFISDPIFSIRKPRNRFLCSEYANKLRNVAFTSEIYNGLAQSLDQFPGLCEGPATVLRRLEGLTHFTLVISEDGAGFEYSGDDEDEVEDEEDEDEEDKEDGQDIVQGDEVGNIIQLNQAAESNAAEDDAKLVPRGEKEPEDSLDEDTIIRRFLDHLEEEAMESMSKGYFRHLGNIHFQSALGHPDHWETWEIYRDELKVSHEQEKEGFPDWIRPKVSVMAVEYGLRRTGDFRTNLHLLGDHTGNSLETIDYTSETENSNGSESDISL